MIHAAHKAAWTELLRALRNPNVPLLQYLRSLESMKDEIVMQIECASEDLAHRAPKTVMNRDRVSDDGTD